MNPGTPVSTLSEMLGDVDQVLVMSVNPGFSGQHFLAGSNAKIAQLRELRSRYNYSFRIEVDGGIAADTIPQVVRAGAEILVAGTTVFHTPDPGAAVLDLQKLAAEALLQRV